MKFFNLMKIILIILDTKYKLKKYIMLSPETEEYKLIKANIADLTYVKYKMFNIFIESIDLENKLNNLKFPNHIKLEFLNNIKKTIDNEMFN